MPARHRFAQAQQAGPSSPTVLHIKSVAGQNVSPLVRVVTGRSDSPAFADRADRESSPIAGSD